MSEPGSENKKSQTRTHTHRGAEWLTCLKGEGKSASKSKAIQDADETNGGRPSALKYSGQQLPLKLVPGTKEKRVS